MFVNNLPKWTIIFSRGHNEEQKANVEREGLSKDESSIVFLNIENTGYTNERKL